MADVPAEHIDAIARVIDPAAFDVDSLDWLARAVIEGPALDLLTSTDPAVHAALLGALARAGALTEKAEDGWDINGRKVRRSWLTTTPTAWEATR